MDVCRRAEATGADALWAVDHLAWPGPMLECLSTLAVAAAVTTRPTIGSCVLQLPLRNPVAVAKQATTIQLISDGRFILGLGVGSHPGEYEEVGVTYEQRGRLLDQGLDELQRAWTSADRNLSVYQQLPTSPPVPIWMGGSSPAARQRAARCGQGWVPLFLAPAEYGEALDHLRAETVAAGRAVDAVQAAVVIFLHVGEGEAHLQRGTHWLSSLYRIPAKAFERHIVTGSAESCADQVRRYLEAGAEHVVAMVADDDAISHFEQLQDALQLVSEENERVEITA